MYTLHCRRAAQRFTTDLRVGASERSASELELLVHEAREYRGALAGRVPPSAQNRVCLFVCLFVIAAPAPGGRRRGSFALSNAERISKGAGR